MTETAPTQSTHSTKPVPSLPKIFALTSALALGIAGVLMLITVVIVALVLRQKLHTFADAAGITPTQFQEILTTAWEQPVLQTDGHKNILLLGVDSLPNRGDVPPLTDTMMLISIELDTGAVRTLSFPRDLWSSEYQTKINALYHYGFERTPEHPEAFPTTVIGEMAGVPIHHTIVMSLQDVAEIIDVIGGVELEITTGFTDPQFPRSDVDITVERDPAVLYKTVTFETGKQVLSGERALEYIRSRHSADDQGTDDARAQRQQQVLEALVKQMSSTQFLLDAATLGKLFALYQNTFAQYFSVEELLATAKALYPHRRDSSFYRATLPITTPEAPGVLIHPPVTTTQSQWVYEVADPADFRTHVQQELGMLDKNE